jgi:hypothetical protein
MVVSKNGQLSAGESDVLPAAASVQSHMPDGFAKVPADVWRELDLCLRSMLGQGLRPCQIDKALKLRQRYGIPVMAIRRYARQLQAAGSLPADVPEARTLAKPNVLTRIPSSTQRLMDTLVRDSLLCLHTRLQDPELTPEQAARLFSALAQQHQALTKALAQKIASHRYTRECHKERREQEARDRFQRQIDDRRKQIRRRLGDSGKMVPNAVLDAVDGLSILSMVGWLTSGRKPPNSPDTSPVEQEEPEVT